MALKVEGSSAVEFFVGREEEVGAAIATLRDFVGPGVGDGVVWEVVGISGIGKRTLLKRVGREAKSVIGRDLMVLDDDVIGPFADAGGMLGDCGPGATAQALMSTLERSGVVMRAFADYFRVNGNPSSFDEFILQCDGWLQSGRRLMKDRRNSASPSAVSATEHADRAELRALQRKMDDTFVVGWAQAATHPVLITLNSFGKLVDDELGNWTLAICPRLAKTLTLLARVPSEGAAVPDPDSSRISKKLPYFTVEQAQTFLQQRFVGAELHPQLATIVHNYTDGHPGGLDLVTKLIMETEKGSGISPEELRRLLDRLPENINERWAGVIDIIVDVVDDSLLRKAVDVVSVTRWFDDALLGCLLEINHTDGADTIDAGEALKRLWAFGLVQPAEDRPGTFRLVEFIRQSLATKMYTTSLQRWQELHRAAASHYMERLELDESKLGGGEYGQWYRYERPGWQADKLQWLYHSGQLTEKRELTRAMFLLVFLEAFFWFGCYVHFDFIPRLIEDWERASRLRVGERPEVIQEDVELAAALAFLVDAYPLGHLKPATAPWVEIQARILRAQRLCGLESESITEGLEDAELRNLARANALVETFLAHTLRFRNPRDPGGRRCYENALKLVDELDSWLACWIVFESADLALEAGRVDDAIALLQGAIVRALEMHDAKSAGDAPVRKRIVVNLGVSTGKWDCELLANLHRLHADACWYTGDRSAAAAAYGKAVTNAYWYQGDPHPPDSYTQQFYDEMTSRVAERVAELRASGSNEVDAFVSGITAQLPSPGSGNGELPPFPQAPGDAEYVPTGSTFMDAWSTRMRERVDPAAELRALLPDAGE